MTNSLVVREPFVVAAVKDVCGEGAMWHPEEGAVYWTDINRFLVHRWDERSNEVKTWEFGEPVTALALTTQEGSILVVLGSKILLWEPVGDRRRELGFHLDGWPEARCNDARVDPAGVLWVESMENNVGVDGAALPVTRVLGKLFSVDGSGAARVWREGLRIGNTMAWSPDERYLFAGDTLANEIYRFDWAADSTIANEVVWFSGHERGLPDGSVMDEEGFLWNCRYGGGCILRVGPDGVLDRVIEIPVANPTTCIFGGKDGRTLYVTSAAASDEGNPFSGALFAIETNVRGLVEGRFRVS
jgi:sugar lactone lactonase YvrE